MTCRLYHVVIMSTLGLAFWTPARSALGKPIKATADLAGSWQLFVDDDLIASEKNVVRRYHPFRKHRENPLIVVDRPWEAHVVNCCTVIPGDDGSGLRMYYYCWTDKDKSGGRGSFMCYAVSEDGLTWEKPNLGLYEHGGNTDNNILPSSPTHVMFTPWEKDPDKRYRGVGGMYHAFSSPDGIHWRQDSTEKIVSGGDTSHFYWDPNTQRFRCTVKGSTGVNGDVSGLRRRVVGFSETTDLTHFPPLRMVMVPDDIDDLWCAPDTVQRTHFYACPVLPYETMYLGFLQIYRAEEPEGYFHGPLWVELTSSRDGVRWQRVARDTTIRQIYSIQNTVRPPLVDLGKFREFDDGMVISPTPVLVDDELWVYYTGYDELHDWLPYRSAIGLAKLRKDGFASMDADECIGEIVTKRFKGVGGPLRVNYAAKGGTIRVEILDSQGSVVPGYGCGECKALTGDSVRETVTWNDKRELPADADAIRFRFILDHARLYSFHAGDNARAMDEPSGPPLQALFTFEGNTEAWSDLLGDDGLQMMRNLGTCTLDHKNPEPAFGRRSLVVGSQWRNWNRVEIEGTSDLGRHFTLAAMVMSKNNQRSRIFSAYAGNFPVKTSELIFECDPKGRVLNGLRLVCKGLEIDSDAATFDDNKYHHLAVVYDDGCVTFYLDGKPAGERWIPGGEPVRLARNLLVGEDAHRGSDEQLQGNVDDVLVYGRALKADEIAALSTRGAGKFFGVE